MVESQKEESESDAAAWPSMGILPRPGLLTNSVGFRDDDWLTSTPIEIFKGDSFGVRGTEEGIGAVAFESLILKIRYMGERQRQGCASVMGEDFSLLDLGRLATTTKSPEDLSGKLRSTTFLFLSYYPDRNRSLESEIYWPLSPPRSKGSPPVLLPVRFGHWYHLWELLSSGISIINPRWKNYKNINEYRHYSCLQLYRNERRVSLGSELLCWEVITSRGVLILVVRTSLISVYHACSFIPTHYQKSFACLSPGLSHSVSDGEAYFFKGSVHIELVLWLYPYIW